MNIIERSILTNPRNKKVLLCYDFANIDNVTYEFIKYQLFIQEGFIQYYNCSLEIAYHKFKKHFGNPFPSLKGKSDLPQWRKEYYNRVNNIPTLFDIEMSGVIHDKNLKRKNTILKNKAIYSITKLISYKLLDYHLFLL